MFWALEDVFPRAALSARQEEEDTPWLMMSRPRRRHLQPAERALVMRARRRGTSCAARSARRSEGNAVRESAQILREQNVLRGGRQLASRRVRVAEAIDGC